MARLNMVKALNLALHQEMERDGDVLIIGEDVGVDGGVFRVTEDLHRTFGSKRVIAFYVPGDGNCGINVVVWDRSDIGGGSAARVRVSLNPHQSVHIDSAENKSINLQCGEYADTLALVDSSKMIAGAAQ